MLNQITYSLPEDLENAVRSVAGVQQQEDLVTRIWARDASVWTNNGEEKWLGWLEIISEELNDLQKYRDLSSDLEGAGFTDILLMGMGGSSLCPELLAKTFGKVSFHILDSTVPAQVISTEKKLDLEKTLFIVASKSGSTLEPNVFKQYFFDRVSQTASRDTAGKQFIAITDPGSKMEQIARDNAFRHIFFGKPDIGGRFSAFSAFGMTAAAAMGLDVERLLRLGEEMSEACRSTRLMDNPGALLGTLLGVCNQYGRDKLTIFAAPEIQDLGAWLEQLIAESTGKEGKAIIPVNQEPVMQPDDYGQDRVFVHLTLKGGKIPDYEFYAIQELQRSAHPFISIELESTYHLAQELFRWEFATAVAGSLMGINPFDQPDVESAKIEAKKLTDEYERSGFLLGEKPFFEEDGVGLFTGENYRSELEGLVDESSISGFLDAHLWNLGDGDYFAILAYIEMDPDHELLLQELRLRIAKRHRVATCLGFGPRFLHSTGQAYKGGPENGLFLQITADDATDVQVPDKKFTFGVVKDAQARGDFKVLIDRGRRALRVHLGSDVGKGLDYLLSAVG